MVRGCAPSFLYVSNPFIMPCACIHAMCVSNNLLNQIRHLIPCQSWRQSSNPDIWCTHAEALLGATLVAPTHSSTWQEATLHHILQYITRDYAPSPTVKGLCVCFNRCLYVSTTQHWVHDWRLSSKLSISVESFHHTMCLYSRDVCFHLQSSFSSWQEAKLHHILQNITRSYAPSPMLQLLSVCSNFQLPNTGYYPVHD